jgi:hypothetical protein
MKHVMLAVLVLLLTSCTTIVKKWVPPNPVNTVVFIDAGAVITSQDGERVVIESNAVLFPLGAFMEIICTYEQAMEAIQDVKDEKESKDWEW